MNKITKIICIIVFCINILITTVCVGYTLIVSGNLTSVENCVTTEEDALAIGKIIGEKKFPGLDYEIYEWVCYFDPRYDYWVVLASEKNKCVMDDLAPCLFIKKDNGQVVEIRGRLNDNGDAAE